MQQHDLWTCLDQHDDAHLAERGVRLWAGDCRAVLAMLPASSVHLNRPEALRLADKARAALGSAIREVLHVPPQTIGWEPDCSRLCIHCPPALAGRAHGANWHHGGGG